MRRRPISRATATSWSAPATIAFTEATLAATPGAQLGEYVRVTVRDNGPGLSDEALDRVFDAAATARPSAALAAETMRRLGGFARVESAERVGTAVHLYFPRVAAADGGAADKARRGRGIMARVWAVGSAVLNFGIQVHIEPKPETLEVPVGLNA